MAKLVIQNQGMTGRAQELLADRTTIGRVEDNTFQIADSSISSHHCEVLLRGSDIVVRDLNSTNGSFINNSPITESVLKPGQTLRLGQVELKLETEGAPALPGAPVTGSPPGKKQMDATATLVMPRGVSLSELESGGGTGFDSATNTFKKKNQKNNLYFWIGAGVAVLIIVGLLVFALAKIKFSGQ